MMSTRRRRIFLFCLAVLTVLALASSAALTVWVDRQQCKSAETAIRNSRTMWEYVIERYPSTDADELEAEMNRRIPPAKCVGGTLHVEKAET